MIRFCTALFALISGFLIFASLEISGSPPDFSQAVCPAPRNLRVQDVTASEAVITWSQADTVHRVALSWMRVGDVDMTTVDSATSPFTIPDLSACEEYIVSLTSVCAESGEDNASTATFETDGCCRIPTGFAANTVSPTLATLEWDGVALGTQFTLRYRAIGQSDWMEISIGATGIALSDLDPCTAYEVQIRTECDSDTTGYSPSLIVQTTECEICTAGDYCQSLAFDAHDAWIDSVSMGNLRMATGFSDGYFAYTGSPAAVERGRSYPFFVAPGFAQDTCPQFFRMWIDLDRDGNFNDTTELLLDEIDQNGSGATAMVTLADTLSLGVTRMRIAMVPVGVSDTITPMPCDIYDFGEVEDYCIAVDDRCPVAEQLDTLFTGMTSATVTWETNDKSVGFIYQYRPLDNQEWESMVTMDTIAELTDLTKCTEYLFELITVCIQDTAVQALVFKTKCDVATYTLPRHISSLRAFPNPFDDHLAVEVLAHEQITGEIRLVDMTGRTISRRHMAIPADQEQRLDISAARDLPPGLYFVMLHYADNVGVVKVVKGK